MGLFERLERALERLIEGRLLGGFRGRVHPIEIARRVAQQMQADRRIGVRRTFVPNVFAVALNPADFDQLEPIEHEVDEEIISYLQRQVKERDYSLPGRIRIELSGSDEVASGGLQVTASFERGEGGDAATSGEFATPPAPSLHVPQPQQQPPYPPRPQSPYPAQQSPYPAQPQSQQSPYPPQQQSPYPAQQSLYPPQPQGQSPSHFPFPLPPPPSAPADPGTRAILLGNGGFVQGKVVPLKVDVVVLGRSPDCGVHVPDAQVSKAHARLEWNGATYVLTNLGRNGTEINGQAISAPRPLANGDNIAMGGSSLHFRLLHSPL